MTPRDRLIFALDVDNADEAENLVRLLAPEVGVFKVGLELFVSAGPEVISRVRRAGAKAIFLDLKLHDIPATMRAAARSAVGLGVDLITCHADQAGIFADMDLGGASLLGVTVLTSLGAEELGAMGYPPELCDPQALVLRRASLALAAGCAGVVCSGREAAAVRGLLGPEALVVCPGIRPASAETHDQKRVMTPERAMAAGASHIVVGRPIRTAADPVAAAQAMVQGIAAGLAQRSPA
ncbi:MAG: orotidine-5'-phosphate decarboxylase [Desulfarculaceae bacterium]|nr:orotidine-5'-phosphate decarboxylase [Desulfarculaceae bacterium]MCF8048258.1 orotidine-5'-phosphate decarboxylase [Desulfarculaceae bacterium]MCF8066423.1 orotidine-5'-phosphate decarboxylase [Desulfarculaceae bacterium]MCF8098369.1 orotidine-5'-phosphate decarboxylase [Desulfarculaceae bacterium]MCF8122868.1 orotidine-5'-phosphate decarboxylase [Desulfarculaceae bacterium]